MPTSDVATISEGAEISRNAGKREICKTMRLAKLGSSGLVLCFLTISLGHNILG
jgi:hypothetical protein